MSFNQNLHIGSNYLYITRTGSITVDSNNVTINSTGRWDGTNIVENFGNDSGTSFNGQSIFSANDTTVYLAGTFTSASGYQYAMKWVDGSGWDSMNSLGSSNSNLYQIAYDGSNGYVYFGGYQAGTTANRIVKYIEASNTWTGIATGFTVTTYPKMTVDGSSNLWLGYGSIVKRYNPGTDAWTDCSSASGTVQDVKYGNNGNVYFAAGNAISYIDAGATGPHNELSGLQGGVSSARGVDVLLDGSIVACFQSPSSGDATNIVQLHNGSSWTGIYPTTNNSGNLGVWVDANGNIYVKQNAGSYNIGYQPYNSSNWVSIAGDLSNITYGGGVGAVLNRPSITVSGGNSQILTKSSVSTISLSATNSPTSWSITPSLSSIGLTLNSSTGEITGTPTAEDISGTQYTVTASNGSGNGTKTLYIAVRDSYAIAMINDATFTVAETISASSISVPDQTTIISDVSAYIPNSSNSVARSKRQTLLKRILNDNSGYQFITSNRASLRLSADYSRDKIRVYRTGTTIDLNDLSGDEGAYAPISNSGELCTFLNVGGNGNTVAFTANGNGTYDITYNSTDIGSGTDGETLAIAGVAFYLGSVGTEGSSSDVICFTGDALVETLDDPIPISQIQKGQTIVTSNSVTTVTQAVRVVNASPELVHIKAGALGHNVPNRDTFVTPEHRILVHGQWCSARELAMLGEWRNLVNINTVPAQPNQYVYHLATSATNHGPNTMIVNGMTVETLDPFNVNVQAHQHKINLTTGTTTQLS